jgi:hypothetical protein
VALCQARISTKPLWGFSSSNPYHSQSRAEQLFFPNENAVSIDKYLIEYVELSAQLCPNFTL